MRIVIKNNAILIFLFLALTVKPVFAGESYWVVMVKGSVFRTGTEKSLKVGDKIDSDAKLKFSDKESYIIVMGPKGRFTLKPEPNKSSNNEFVAFVNSALMPVKSPGRLSTRGEESTGITDLGSYFGEENFAFLGENHTIKLNAQKFELSESKFLIYRYEYNGKAISKKIAFEGSNLVFDKNALYIDANGNPINSQNVKQVDIYKFDSGSGSSTKLVSFRPSFVNEIEAKELFASLYPIYLDEMKLSSAQIEDELIKLFVDVYGRTDETLLKKWIKESISK